MPLIATRIPRTRQPQNAARPLGDGLVFAWEGSHPQSELAYGIRMSTGSGVASTPSQHGITATFSGSQADLAVSGTFDGLAGATASTFDILVYFAIANPTAKLFSQWDGDHRRWTVEVSGGTLIWVAGDGFGPGTARSRFDLSGAIPSAGWYRLQGAWYGQGSAELLLNGQRQSLSVIQTDCTLITSTPDPIQIGASGGQPLTGQVAFARVWRRGLSLGELRALYGLPWGIIFAPIERRIWVPVGGAVPNITAVYADSVTASSVVPRVTLDYA